MPSHHTRLLTQYLRQQGFVLLRVRKHAIWRHLATGRTLVVGLTPSDHRELQNVRAHARRIVRGRHGRTSD